MATGQQYPGVCAHCGGEVAEDGFAVKMAEGGEAEKETEPEETPPADRDSSFFAALRMRRAAPSSSPSSSAAEEG